MSEQKHINRDHQLCPVDFSGLDRIAIRERKHKIAKETGLKISNTIQLRNQGRLWEEVEERQKKNLLTPQERIAVLKVSSVLAQHKKIHTGESPTNIAEGLDLKRLLFVEHFMANGGDSRKAAKSAGYKIKDDDEWGNMRPHTLLKNPVVRAAISRRVEEVSEKLKISRDRILQEYARIAFAQVTDYYDIVGEDVVVKPKDQLTEDQRAAIADISIFENISTGTRKIAKVKLHDKTDALKSLAKIWGLFEKDNQQRSQVNVRVEDVISGLPKHISDAVQQRLMDDKSIGLPEDSRTIN